MAKLSKRLRLRKNTGRILLLKKVLRWRLRTRESTGSAFPYFATGLLYFFFIASLYWLKINNSASRYALLSILLFQAGSVHLLMSAVWSQLSGNNRMIITSVLMVAVCMTGLGRYGLPSLNKARASVDIAMGTFTKDLITADCTHMVGSYWKVWPAISHAKMPGCFFNVGISFAITLTIISRVPG